MLRGGFRSPEGEGRGQVVRVLGIGDGYAGCRQMRAVEEGKDEGGISKKRIYVRRRQLASGRLASALCIRWALTASRTFFLIPCAQKKVRRRWLRPEASGATQLR